MSDNVRDTSAPPRTRTTRTTEMQALDRLSLGDLQQFVEDCIAQGWTSAASVSVRQQAGDRPGERTTYTLRVVETR